MPGQVSSLGRASDSAQGLQERQALYNMEMRYGRLQAQPHIDSRSVIAHATEVVVNTGEFATMMDVAEVSGGTWNKREQKKESLLFLTKKKQKTKNRVLNPLITPYSAHIL